MPLLVNTKFMIQLLAGPGVGQQEPLVMLTKQSLLAFQLTAEQLAAPALFILLFMTMPAILILIRGVLR